MNTYCFIIALLYSACNIVMGQEPGNNTYLIAGSYTNDKPARGIYVYSIDMESGALTKKSSSHNITNPSYLTLSPDGSKLYACTETRMLHAGSVSAFSFDSVSGAVTFINKQPSGGENPVYLAVHKSNKWLVNGNYAGGSLSVYPLERDGSIGTCKQLIQFTDSSIDPERQASAHIHSAVFSPAKRKTARSSCNAFCECNSR
jgi:6-phosphogluconolactonase